MQKAVDCTTGEQGCNPATCRINCALEVVDSLLRASATVRGEEVDALLDLRWLLHQRKNAESVLGLFCQLRRTMEERHYLAFYRLRRWLENHIQVTIQASDDSAQQLTPLKLDRYCLEAVRYDCLPSPSSSETALAKPRVQFSFVHAPAEVTGADLIAT